MNPASINEQQESPTAREYAGVHRPRPTEAPSRKRSTIDIGRMIDIGRNLGVQIEEQAKRRPFVMLGAAIGVGFAGGSLFGSRFGQMVLAAGIGYALRNAAGSGADPIRTGLERIASEVGAG